MMVVVVVVVVVVMMMMMVDRNYIKKPLRSSRQTSIRPWSAAYITAFFPAYKRFLRSRVCDRGNIAITFHLIQLVHVDAGRCHQLLHDLQVAIPGRHVHQNRD